MNDVAWVSMLMHAHPTRCIEISLVAKWNETLSQRY